MRSFSIITDNLEAIASIMGCCSSIRLRQPYFDSISPFQNLLISLASRDMNAAANAAQNLIFAAMRSIPTKIATVEVDTENFSILFRTPHDVGLKIFSFNREYALEINFHRDSTVLATNMLCGLIPIVGAGKTIIISENNEWPERPIGEVLASMLLAQVSVPVAS